MKSHLFTTFHRQVIYGYFRTKNYAFSIIMTVDSHSEAYSDIRVITSTLLPSPLLPSHVLNRPHFPNSRCHSLRSLPPTSPSVLAQPIQLASAIRRIKILIRPTKPRFFVRKVTSRGTFKPHINPDPAGD